MVGSSPSPPGRAAHRVLGTHSFLSGTEELGHVPDDVAEVVVHLDVGAHPRGQLGPGVYTREPSVEAVSLGALPTSPTAQVGHQAGRGSHTCSHRGRWPHSHGDAG